MHATNDNQDAELEIDKGTLLAAGWNAFDTNSLRNKTEEYLESLTREHGQSLINQIWALPTDRIDEAFVAILPKPTFILPRARAVPKPKPLTKWQQFAKKKGISLKKKGKSKLKWDDELKKWIPTFGFQRSKATDEKNWLIEEGDFNTPKADPRKTLSITKQERVAKNELQRLRNIAKSNNVKILRTGLPTTERFATAKHLALATTVARVSTASAGKFQSKLPKEKDAKGIDKELYLKKKRKLAPLNVAEEQKRNTALVNDIVDKKSTKNILRMDTSSASANSSKVTPESKKKGNRKSSAKKPKAGNGKRDLHTKVGGRKRRG